MAHRAYSGGKPINGFSRSGVSRLHFALKPDRDPYADGTRRFSVAIKADQWSAEALYLANQRGQALYNRAQTQIEEAYRQIEAQFTAEKMQQLTHLLEEFIALGNSRQEDIPGDNE